jgi:hypothetical protein
VWQSITLLSDIGQLFDGFTSAIKIRLVFAFKTILPIAMESAVITLDENAVTMQQDEPDESLRVALITLPRVVSQDEGMLYNLT